MTGACSKMHAFLLQTVLRMSPELMVRAEEMEAAKGMVGERERSAGRREDCDYHCCVCGRPFKLTEQSEHT